MWLWGLEVTILNAYKMMTRYCKLRGIEPNYSHHDFREKIGYALLDPDIMWPKRKSKTPPKAAQGKRRAASPNATTRSAKFTKKSLKCSGML